MGGSNIIFVVGPISSGKSTVAKFIKNSTTIEIDDIYDSHLNGRSFSQAYSDKSFQDTCWNDFYKKIKAAKQKDTSVVALTTGLNPRFKKTLNKLKKEFPNQVYVIKINSKKGLAVSRTKQRKGVQKRKISATLDTHKKLKNGKIHHDFAIDNNKDLKALKEKVFEILKIIETT